MIAGKEIKIEEDPIWWINGNPISINLLQNCIIETQTKELPIYGLCFLNWTDTYIDNVSKTSYLKFNSKSYSCKIDSYFDYINTTTCTTYGFNVSGKTIRWDNGKRKCYFNSPYITCKVQYQSDMSYPYCKSGEGCEIINVRDMTINTIGISPTKQIEDLKIQ